ncbi:MAG: membrane dipeptidase [Clostridia bacterium]|nr:membrane dipeptidase [Clostridia bacterium]MBO7289306.1 membrane dipeptidase [Clostridia bacterium]
MNKKYPYFDSHCDTLSKLFSKKASLNNTNCMVNISHLKKYDGAAQVFAIYNNGTLTHNDIISHISYLKKECESYNGFISFAMGADEITRNRSREIISALLSIESLGSQKDLTLENIGEYKALGVIIMSLCHNNDNALCGGISNNNKGISLLGKVVLRQMQKHKVILDVSHISEKGFWEAMEEYSLPFMATHSNSRSVCNNPRNLTDSQFMCLVKRGGLCGINFCPEFLCDKNADIDSVVGHIDYFMSLGGENSICIGSDFDGIEKTSLGLENAGCVYRLFDKLLSINYNESLVNKIAFSNFHNFFKKYETLT